VRFTVKVTVRVVSRFLGSQEEPVRWWCGMRPCDGGNVIKCTLFLMIAAEHGSLLGLLFVRFKMVYLPVAYA